MADNENQENQPQQDPSIKDKIKEGKDKLKEGVSMQEIEGYAKRYSTEVFMVLAIIIAVISSIFDFFIGSGWGIFLAGLGALFGLLMPKQANTALDKMFEFSTNSDKSMQIMIGVIRIVVAIFVPAIIFGIFGLVAGTTFQARTKKD
jgi:F0F1-type ATP synthase assembly protein I